MNDDPFAAGIDILSRRAGLRLDPALRKRIERSLRDGADAHSMSLSEYVRALEKQPHLLQDLLNRVTVQETAFFRDPGQFEALGALLPSLPARQTVWSAGCANGQEAYSLAMLILEHGASASVLASDLSTQALERARAGWYSNAEIKGLDEHRRARFLRRDGDGWAVVPKLRERVTFVHHNLVSDPLPVTSSPCRVVFCRNVLIYFGRDDLLAFLERLGAWMPADAYLFLGYSESLWQVTDRFRLERRGNAFVYCARGTATSVPAADHRSLGSTTARRPSRTSLKELLAMGEASAAAGDYTGAANAFARAAQLDPDHPIVHFQLGASLEAAGKPAPARLAYASALAAINHGNTARVQAALEGYSLGALTQLLRSKLRATRT